MNTLKMKDENEKGVGLVRLSPRTRLIYQTRVKHGGVLYDEEVEIC